MKTIDRGVTRRDLFRLAGTAAVCGVAAGAPAGCASMPAVGGGEGGHPCDSHYCRYYRATRGGGRCALSLRESGGVP